MTPKSLAGLIHNFNNKNNSNNNDDDNDNDDDDDDDNNNEIKIIFNQEPKSPRRG